MVDSIQFPMVGLPGVILDFIITQGFLTPYLKALWMRKFEEQVAVPMSNDVFYTLAASLSIYHYLWQLLNTILSSIFIFSFVQ